jgi:hypothetical protein
MNAIVPLSQSNLPDTRGRYGVAPTEKAMAYVECRYVAPILDIYSGGQKLDECAKDLIVQAYTRPSPADLRSCVATVHNEKPEAQLERVMSAHYRQRDQHDRRRIWDPAIHGPKPGQPGCRIAPHSQERVWRDLIDLHARGPGYDVHVTYENGIGGCWARLPCPSGFGLLELINRHSPDRIDPRDPACPIPRHILTEYEIPVTDREIAAGNGEFVQRIKTKREKMLATHRAHLAEMEQRAAEPRMPAPPPAEPKPTCGFVSDLMVGI